jgi:hypothetical protein
MQFFRALMGHRSCPYTSASRPRIIEHDKQSISAWCWQKVFKAPRLTTKLDAPWRKLVCCCASHKIKAG